GPGAARPGRSDRDRAARVPGPLLRRDRPVAGHDRGRGAHALRAGAAAAGALHGEAAGATHRGAIGRTAGGTGPVNSEGDGPRRIERALEAYLAFRASGEAPAEFLARHEDLRDLIECMLSEAAPAVEPDAEPKRTLGDFRLLREVGRGGMGVVYEARQLSLD